jgi:glycerophosphoryl diester phosphodiesterase
MPMPSHPLLLGHRGARAKASIPENTIEAFDLALAQGCDGFEFDVRLSGDGTAVICHDDNVRGFEVAQCATQLLGLPGLHDVLQRYQSSAFLDIELKVAGLEGITLSLLQAFPPTRGYVISSFLPEVLHTIHEADSSIPLGVICETRDQLGLWSKLPIQWVKPHYTLVREAVIDEIHGAGKNVLVWTVNATAEMKRFAGWGADGIISDYPERLTAAWGRQQRRETRK